MPVVTVIPSLKWSGYPSATTPSPSRIRVARGSAVRGSSASTLSSAMSRLESNPITRGVDVAPSSNITVSSSSPAITCAFVRMWPAGSMTNPDPAPVLPWIRTMPSLTFSTMSARDGGGTGVGEGVFVGVGVLVGVGVGVGVLMGVGVGVGVGVLVGVGVGVGVGVLVGVDVGVGVGVLVGVGVGVLAGMGVGVLVGVGIGVLVGVGVGVLAGMGVGVLVGVGMLVVVSVGVTVGVGVGVLVRVAVGVAVGVGVGVDVTVGVRASASKVACTPATIAASTSMAETRSATALSTAACTSDSTSGVGSGPEPPEQETVKSSTTTATMSRTVVLSLRIQRDGRGGQSIVDCNALGQRLPQSASAPGSPLREAGLASGASGAFAARLQSPPPAGRRHACGRPRRALCAI